MLILENIFRTLPDFKGKRRLGRWLFRNKINTASNIEVVVPSGILYQLPNLKEALAYDIFINGIYEQGTHEFLLQSLPVSGLFLDLGANIGSISIPLLKKRPDLQCIAVEAAPWIFDILENNVQRNSLTGQMRLFNRALWDTADVELPFYSPEDKFGTGSLSPVFTRKSVPVRSITIDDLIEICGVKRVDVIKIDIEGYEYFAFLGARKLLERSDAPDILFEMVDWAQQLAGVNAAAEQEVLRGFGYNIFCWDATLKKWVQSPNQTTGFHMLLASKKSIIK
jgi:FkbM family methyltransferase